MPAIIETTELISKTMDELIDFIVTDEFLSNQFEAYLIKNKIEINKEAELNDVLISYILDGKIQSGERVLDYFLNKNKKADKKTIEALFKSFISVFQIKKISKNNYDATDIVSNTDFALTPLVKTTNLRGIGLYDYIKARVVEIDENFYLLEIFDCISSYREYFANIEAVKAVVQNPKIAVLNNREKFLEIKKSVLSFHSSFLECFGGDEVVVLNKDADKLLNDFYSYHKGDLSALEYEKIPDDFNFEYFDVKEFENDFLIKASSGFSNSEKPYDIGIYSDSEFGLFVIPFLGTFNKILEKGLNEKDSIECIKYFLLNDRVPPNLLKKKAKEFKNFLSIINSATDSSFEEVEEILKSFKGVYEDGFNFSSVNVLYDSKVFSKVLGKKEEIAQKTVGRNDPCPCGSGKKYKKCCLNKVGV